jgi:hypothetical protein
VAFILELLIRIRCIFDSWSRIRNRFYPDSESRGHQIPDPDPQHWIWIVIICSSVGAAIFLGFRIRTDLNLDRRITLMQIRIQLLALKKAQSFKKVLK